LPKSFKEGILTEVEVRFKFGIKTVDFCGTGSADTVFTGVFSADNCSVFCGKVSGDAVFIDVFSSKF